MVRFSARALLDGTAFSEGIRRGAENYRLGVEEWNPNAILILHAMSEIGFQIQCCFSMLGREMNKFSFPVIYYVVLSTINGNSQRILPLFEHTP